MSTIPLPVHGKTPRQAEGFSTIAGTAPNFGYSLDVLPPHQFLLSLDATIITKENEEKVKTLEIIKVESQYELEQKAQENRLAQVVERNPLLRKIAQCESRYDIDAQNSQSTASGLFQFIDSTWDNYKGYKRAKDAPESIQWEKAIETYNKRGTSPWNASKSCWSTNVSPASNSTVKTVQSNSYPTCSCVLFAKAYSGKNPGSIGYAKNWPINSSTPTVGAVGITTESSGGTYTGHVFVVKSVNGNGTINTIEANYGGCGIYERVLPINSSVIRGYYV